MMQSWNPSIMQHIDLCIGLKVTSFFIDKRFILEWFMMAAAAIAATYAPALNPAMKEILLTCPDTSKSLFNDVVSGYNNGARPWPMLTAP